MPDTSVSAYLERFNNKVTIRKMWLNIQQLSTVDELKPWQEDWRQKEISRQATVKLEFMTYFGLEFTPELAAKIAEAINGAAKGLTK